MTVKVGGVWTLRNENAKHDVQVRQVRECELGPLVQFVHLSEPLAGLNGNLLASVFVKTYVERDFLAEQADVIRYGEVWFNKNEPSQKVTVISCVHSVVAYDHGSYLSADIEPTFRDRYQREQPAVPPLPLGLSEHVYIEWSVDGVWLPRVLTSNELPSHGRRTFAKAPINWTEVQWA